MADLKAIRVFLAVATQLSFSGAAQTLGLTPASVTRIIAKLETDLGQQLLLRTTRQVSLTNAGAMVAARYRPIVAEFDQAAQDILRAHRPDTGHLRINAPLSMGVRTLPSLIARFRLTYPQISLDIRLTDTLVDVIAEDCDLAIRVSGPPRDTSTIWRKICEIPRYAIAAPALFERIPTPQTPEDIDPVFALSYSADGTPETWSFTRSGVRRRVQAGSAIISNNGDFLYAMSLSGAGICVLPEVLVRDGIADGKIVQVLPDWQLPSLWLTLYYPPYEKLPPLVATFTEFFEAHLRDLDGLMFV